MTPDQVQSWNQVFVLAQSLAPLDVWRDALATHLHEATGQPAVVFTARPGNLAQADWACAPPETDELAEAMLERFLPAQLRQGGVLRLVTERGTVFATDAPPAGDDAPWAGGLTPAAAGGLVHAFALDRTSGLPVVWIVLGCAGSPREALVQLAEPLGALCEAIGDHLQRALELARAFAPVSGPSAAARSLSARQRQIALLAAQGLSNLNVAARVGISEATVAVHLRTIYRKLDVHSRAQLANTILGRQVAG